MRPDVCCANDDIHACWCRCKGKHILLACSLSPYPSNPRTYRKGCRDAAPGTSSSNKQRKRFPSQQPEQHPGWHCGACPSRHGCHTTATPAQFCNSSSLPNGTAQEGLQGVLLGRHGCRESAVLFLSMNTATTSVLTSLFMQHQSACNVAADDWTSLLHHSLH